MTTSFNIDIIPSRISPGVLITYPNGKIYKYYVTYGWIEELNKRIARIENMNISIGGKNKLLAKIAQETKKIAYDVQKENRRFNGRNKMKKYIKEDLQDITRAGGSLTITDDGDIKLSSPGWRGPEIHPYSAYATSKKHFKNFDNFMNEIEYYETINKMPRLEVSKNNLTEAMFILFGGAVGLNSWIESEWESYEKSEKEYYINEEGLSQEEAEDIMDKKYDNVYEDDFLWHVWVYLDLKSERDIINFIENKDSIYDLLEASNDYFYSL